MIRRAMSILMGGLLLAGLTVIVPSPALAADNARRAQKYCVTRSEYLRLRGGESPAQVRRIFGTNGYEYDRQDLREVVDGYYEGEWVDGYWDEVSGIWVDPYWDEFGGNWVDGYETTGLDLIRKYKKCRSFDRGRGLVGVAFDDYSFTPFVLGAFARERYHPSYLRAWWPDPGARKQAKVGNLR